MRNRLPSLGDRLLEHNDWLSDIQRSSIHRLLSSLRPNLDGIADSPGDDAYKSLSLPRPWAEIAWYPAEALFFRLLLECTDYFSNLIDPWQVEKRMALLHSLKSIEEMYGRFDPIPNQRLDAALISQLLKVSMSANRVDLCLWTSGEAAEKKGDSSLLADDVDAVSRQLHSNVRKLAVILDNSAMEVCCDLLLCYALLSSGTVDEVTLHTKAWPTYVSDVTDDDFDFTIHMMRLGWRGLEQSIKTARQGKNDKLTVDCEAVTFPQRVAQFLLDAKHQNRLHVISNPFWNSPFEFFEKMPDRLSQKLQEADMVISKGDANYRRCIGDRRWDPVDSSFVDAVAYFPRHPLVCLRTLKSEVAAGLDGKKVEMARKKDADWMTSGKWGVIQIG